MTQPSRPSPSTDDEWTIHALNIHGEFFERRCADVVAATGLWNVKHANYPVAVHGHESNLDLWIEAHLDGIRILLLTECKKNNPDFTDWIFFERRKNSKNALCSYPFVAPTGEETQLLCNFGPVPQLITDVGREARGNYHAYRNNSDKTKTSNAAIQDAARQIAIAAEYVWKEEAKRTQFVKSTGRQEWCPPVLVVPVIVTTANLKLCHFEDRHVNVNTGEIPIDKATLSETDDVLIYEYPLPTHLQYPKPPHPSISYEPFVRRHIVVVQSAKFESFLKNIAPSLKHHPRRL